MVKLDQLQNAQESRNPSEYMGSGFSEGPRSEEGITASHTLLQEAAQAQEVLCRARTVFPFILFPDDVVVDRVKITITRRLFFGHAQVTSNQIEDILNVTASNGPFFSSLKIFTRFFNERPLTIKYLRRADAMHIERVLQGYIIARHQNVDTSSMAKEQLVPLLIQLGETAPSQS